MSVDELLVCRMNEGDSGALTCALGRELHGAFGGAFGGAVAACALRAARHAAPGRDPASLDVRFLRGLPAGHARVAPTVLHAGRSLATVAIDITAADGRLAARATVGLVGRGALYELDDPGAAAAPDIRSYDDGAPWRAPNGVEIPILTTLSPRVLGSGPSWVASGLRLPWAATAGAEASCFAADLCVGPPVAAACGDRWIPHPNPDLSLRFLGEPGGTDLAGIGRVDRIAGGLAGVAIEVWSGGVLVATGVSSSLLLPVPAA